MITEKDLQEAIAECQGVRNPTASTCMKLAAYYTLLDHMGEEVKKPSYSYDIGLYKGDSEFAKETYGRNLNEIMPIMDELMDALYIMNPRLYDCTMRKISGGD